MFDSVMRRIKGDAVSRAEQMVALNGQKPTFNRLSREGVAALVTSLGDLVMLAVGQNPVTDREDYGITHHTLPRGRFTLTVSDRKLEQGRAPERWYQITRGDEVQITWSQTGALVLKFARSELESRGIDVQSMKPHGIASAYGLDEFQMRGIPSNSLVDNRQDPVIIAAVHAAHPPVTHALVATVIDELHTAA